MSTTVNPADNLELKGHFTKENLKVGREDEQPLAKSELDFKIPKFFITQNELAELFKISPQAAHMWMKYNQIESFKFKNKTALIPSETRKFMSKKGFNYPHLILAFQMLKGGSTKTSCAFNLAVRLNQYGARVLCVDADMQGNLTDSFGIDIDDDDSIPLLIDVVRKQASINEAIININEGLDIIPSDFENSSLELEINSLHPNLKTFISKILEPVKNNYDFIIIDCNPSLSALNISIALSADKLIIPVNPDKFSRKGLKKSIKEIQRWEESYGSKFDYQLLFTLYDAREASSQRYLIEYGNLHHNKLISTVIRRNADVKNAIDRKLSIFDFKKAPAREDFDLLALEMLGLRDMADKK